MIGLDTNVIVRYLTQDDPIQSTKATQLFERRLTEQNPGFVSVVAVTEMVWVLERSYGFSESDVSSAIERLLQADVLLVENEQEVFNAMVAVRKGRGSFADAIIVELGTKAGCTRTLTFDKKAARLANCALL